MRRVGKVGVHDALPTVLFGGAISNCEMFAGGIVFSERGMPAEVAEIAAVFLTDGAFLPL